MQTKANDWGWWTQEDPKPQLWSAPHFSLRNPIKSNIFRVWGNESRTRWATELNSDCWAALVFQSTCRLTSRCLRSLTTLISKVISLLVKNHQLFTGKKQISRWKTVAFKELIVFNMKMRLYSHYKHVNFSKFFEKIKHLPTAKTNLSTQCLSVTFIKSILTSKR